MTLVPGSRLGPYEILAPLGAGGMGEVYRARDPRLGRDIAIKVLPEDVGSSPDRLARFEREAMTVAGLNHPNIVTLHSIENEGSVRFLTMELVEGKSLLDLVTPGGLSLTQLLELAIPLSGALVAAHEKGVVHRDLKPSNVMVTRDGRIKVLDFGLAKLTQAARELAPTMTSPLSDPGRVVGTVPYMSPEQIRGEAVDTRTDLFSFGTVLFELATGTRPFEGQTPADVTSAILRDAPSRLGTLRSDLPEDLERILDRCLEKQPRERFQTALDVENELRALRRKLERGEPLASKARSENVASIAVLPFANRSASADDEYFSDGLADELLSLLAKIQGLRVAARTSSAHFKGKDTTIAEIGKTLNVAAVLEGSVRKAGPRVRIAVQLVKVSDGYPLWSESYDRTLDDIFAVQDDIAQSVVKELRTTLLGEQADSAAAGQAKADVAQAVRGRSSDPEAYRYYLQALHFRERRTRTDTERAIGFLKQALELDPKFALAWAALSKCYENQAAFGWVLPADGYGLAREAAERALSIEPDLADGHVALAWVQLRYDWNWKGAEASARHALQLAPTEASVLRVASTLRQVFCRFDEAIDLLRLAVDQDPLGSSNYHSLGVALGLARRFPEAEAALRKALDLTPQRMSSHSQIAYLFLAQGRAEEALAEAEKETSPELRGWISVIALHRLGRWAESDRILQGLLESFAKEGAFQLAEVYGARGDVDAAFTWLERAFEQHDPGLSVLMTEEFLAPLHGDPRWRPFLEKMGFLSS